MVFIPYYILILFVTIGIDYYAGIKIEQVTGSRKKVYLIMSIVSTILVLAIFKYFNFLDVNIHTLAGFLHWNYQLSLLNIILPIGLSFHTFQSLSYVIEVYYGRQKAEKDFGIYSLYVMFFPQLVAGPIERPQNLLHQFYDKHYFDYDRVTAGLQRMGWGFFKKMLIADNLAIYVGQIYQNPSGYSSLTILLATFFFTIQIYCDFSGYSDIAIGGAQVLGFKLMENFKNPYFSLSIPEFWSRWHISLSTWFRDYLYIPLGGNKVSFFRWGLNIILVFLVSGLWHGANWTFVIWGLIHGIYTVGYKIAEKLSSRIAGTFNRLTLYFVVLIKWFITFSFVSIAWIFFRASTVTSALYILKRTLLGFIDLTGAVLLSIIKINIEPVREIIRPLSQPLSSQMYLLGFFGLILVLIIAEIIDYHSNLITTIRRQKSWVQWTIYIIAILCIMNLGVTRETPFIYFQF
ncbi:MAG: MBOAT family O-acyltransferase [Minisyncoccia bacterium]